MKKTTEGAAAGGKTPKIDPEENLKRTRRLEIQKDVLRKIMNPITEQLQKDKLNEAKTTVKKKN
ncbi:MAG: hypothetical protein NT040_03725 [Bacteroidetes bacterium]|nr:hypothetical protein [Bacteroidota bacterium]